MFKETDFDIVSINVTEENIQKNDAGEQIFPSNEKFVLPAKKAAKFLAEQDSSEILILPHQKETNDEIFSDFDSLKDSVVLEVNPLKFEIIASLMIQSEKFSHNEIFKVKITDRLIQEAESANNKKIELRRLQENHQALLLLQAAYIETFFEPLPVMLNKNTDKENKRQTFLPKYTLKSFERLRQPTWIIKVDQFFEAHKNAIGKLQFWHAVFFKSEFKKLHECLTQTERQHQAISAFYYLLYKNNRFNFMKIDSIIYKYAKTSELDIFIALGSMNRYIDKKNLSGKDFYKLYLSKVLSENSQTELLHESYRLEKENEKKVLAEFKEQLLQYGETIGVQNKRIKELESIDTAKEVKVLQGELEKATKALNTYMLTIESLEKKCTILKKNLSMLALSKNQLQNQYDEATKKNQLLLQENKILQENNQTLQQELQEYKKQLKTMKEQKIQAEYEVTVLREQLHQNQAIVLSPPNSFNLIEYDSSLVDEDSDLSGSHNNSIIDAVSPIIPRAAKTLNLPRINSNSNFFQGNNNTVAIRPPTARPVQLQQNINQPPHVQTVVEETTIIITDKDKSNNCIIS